jgi:hypothetical protein
MGRRKSVPNKQSNVTKDDSFDEETAIEIYGKGNFEAPVNQGLETVFEVDENDENGQNRMQGPVRASKAKLQPKLRLLISQPYFIEDKDKEILRRKQTAKLFKGRKKFKWNGLSEKQEAALLTSIAEKDDTVRLGSVSGPLILGGQNLRMVWGRVTLCRADDIASVSALGCLSPES